MVGCDMADLESHAPGVPPPDRLSVTEDTRNSGMSLQERILLALSRSPESGDYASACNEWSLEEALSLLEREYTHFGKLVSGRQILDFGCGEGYQCVALAGRYHCGVLGIESNPKSLQRARELALQEGIPPDQLDFAPSVSESMLGRFDIVISQNSFEHFPDPAGVLQLMGALAKADGKILITFGSPWLSPYGSHMHFFCRWPWVNVLFSERAVMAVRGRFRTDGATRYEEVELGLNKMTIAKFERVRRESRMRVEYKHYRCVKGINIFSHLPLAREFFINHVSVILSKSP
jgi:SAM-dependent methyltransferase